jgi:hypothetical protein
LTYATIFQYQPNHTTTQSSTNPKSQCPSTLDPTRAALRALSRPALPLYVRCPIPLLTHIEHNTLLTHDQVGNALGGITKTAGGLVGTAGRGVGETINNTTGTKAVGDGLQGITGGIEDGANSAGKGVENAGQGKKSW